MQAPVMTDTMVYRNALPVGTELMEYRLEAVLGAGGFGITYLGWDAHLHKQVALKEFLPCDIALRALDGSIVPVGTQRNEDYRWGLERFLQEARTLARFSHPHIVRVYRYFEANNTAYMVMDYEHGESLNRLLKREPYPAEERLRGILLPLLDGLRAVHEAGFLHRDIKPSNIFLREQGGPVLIDFGAARHTIGGSGNYTAVVTPGYAPIEQYSTDAAQGAWSDIYAVAGVFYRAVTNENPPDAVGRMRRDTVGAQLYKARERYSAALLSAIGWGLETEESRRPQTVAEWQEGLLGNKRMPYELREPVAPSTGDEPPTRLLTHIPRVTQWRLPAGARWALPVVAAVGVLVWRAYDERLPEMPTMQAAPTAAVSGSAVSTTESPALEPTLTKPEPKAAPSVQRSTQQRKSAAMGEKPRPKDRVAKAADEPVEQANPEEVRAPVRDAIALPPLRDVSRERPSRDRTARPGTEPY
ncbi:MAG: serine/threonine protein kinase [Rhodospirillaceae bacterium]